MSDWIEAGTKAPDFTLTADDGTKLDAEHAFRLIGRLGNVSATRPVSIAVSTKTCWPQTIGVEVPLPGIATFQRTFLLSSQLVGGFPLGAVPLASGPRH